MLSQKSGPSKRKLRFLFLAANLLPKNNHFSPLLIKSGKRQTRGNEGENVANTKQTFWLENMKNGC
jgi:hypothetical protein